VRYYAPAISLITGVIKPDTPVIKPYAPVISSITPAIKPYAPVIKPDTK
jgi:hypothetical protein